MNVSGYGLECIHDTGHGNPVSNLYGPISSINFINPIKTSTGATYWELKSTTGLCVNTLYTNVGWDSCVPGDVNEHFMNHGAIVSMKGSLAGGGFLVWIGGNFGLNPLGEWGNGPFNLVPVNESVVEAAIYG